MKSKHAGWSAVAVLVVAFIAPTFALPLGPDSSMFYVSAQKILHQGAIHYRDIVELKPPPIYYLYAVALFVHESAMSIRVLDVLLQLLTCVGIVVIIRRTGHSNAWAATSALIYAAMYGGLGYAYTMECESYVGLLLVGIAWMVLVRRTRLAFVVAGALAGAAALLKFPFGIVLGAILMCELTITRVTWSAALKNIALTLAGFGAMLGLFALYLIAGDALDGFAEMNAYIAGYAQTRGGGIAALATALMREAPEKITVALSGSVVVAIVAAIPLAMRDTRRPNASVSDEQSRRNIQLLQFMLVALALLVISLVVEGKYYPYQIARLQLPAAIVAAYSIVAAIRYTWHRRSDKYVRIVGAAMLALALVFSPATSWLWFTAAPVALKAARGQNAYDAYFDRMSFYYPRSELLRVGEYIRKAYPKGSRVLTLSSIGGLIHYHSGTIPQHRIYHTCFLLGSISPPQWREEIRRYALDQRPEFIVAQRGDLIFDQTGSNAPSITMIDTLELREMLDLHYVVATETETKQLVVYRRNAAAEHGPDTTLPETEWP